MRYLASLVLVLALGLMGCSEESGMGVRFEEATFSYSVITSSSGQGTDLLDELRTSTLPTLENAGAVVYALWGPAAEQAEVFSGISEDQIVVMLAWSRVDTESLATELESLAGASQVETSLFEASLRGDEPLATGPGFYVHAFELYQTEDVDHALWLSESAWVTFEPTFDNEVVGVWRNLEEEEGLTWTTRIAWYEDLDHWQDSRDFIRDPDSFAKFIERAALQEDSERWSAALLER